MDLVCAPSFSEGFSNTVLEAMAVGKPVVASNIGGNPEIVVGGETGDLVKPQDAGALDKALIPFLQDAAMRLKMGEVGKRGVEKEFSAEKMTREYENFYEQLHEVANLVGVHIVSAKHNVSSLLLQLFSRLHLSLENFTMEKSSLNSCSTSPLVTLTKPYQT